MLVCQDRECGHRETISRHTNARCPVCHKKMDLIGKGDGQRFVCVCGHKEKLSAFEERKNLAKKSGEEAGTKMLFPMMMMFGIIIVIIMVPAFLSLQ